MLMKKSALISIAMIFALTACGGGGGSDDSTPPTNQPPTSNPGGDNPPTTGGGDVDESLMAGHFVLAGNQVLFDVPVDLTEFQTTGAYGQAKGDHFPIRTFGLRLMPVDMTIEGGQSKRVRVAFELDDPADQEAVQMLIDQVDIAIDDAGTWTVTVPATATLYVHASDAAGAAANLAVQNIPADLVQLTAIADDPSSKGLAIDLDRAFTEVVTNAPAADQAVFNSVVGFAGTLDLRTTISNITIQEASADSNSGAELTGTPITVTGSDQPAVTGAGVAGKLQLE